MIVNTAWMLCLDSAVPQQVGTMLILTVLTMLNDPNSS